MGRTSELATKGAFGLQRSKLHPVFFKVWNKLPVDCFLPLSWGQDKAPAGLDQEAPRHFVMRCRLDFNKEAKALVKSGMGSAGAELYPSEQAIRALYKNGYGPTKHDKIKVRMAKAVLGTGRTGVLLTNPYDVQRCTVDDFKYLYGLRWGIETAYGTRKNQLQMERSSGHRPICIRPDYLARLFVYNLQSLIEKQCKPYLRMVNQKREHEYKINKNISWAFLKHNIVKLFLENGPGPILVELKNPFQKHIEPIRPGRHNKRIKKMRRTKGKFQTLINYKRAI